MKGQQNITDRKTLDLETKLNKNISKSELGLDKTETASKNSKTVYQTCLRVQWMAIIQRHQQYGVSPQ